VNIVCFLWHEIGQNQLSFLIGRKANSKVLTERNERSQIHSQTCSLAKLRSQRDTHIVCLTRVLMGRHDYSHSIFCCEFFFAINFFYVVPRLGLMVCFYTSCAGLASTCADTNINVGDTIRYSCTKDTELLSFVLCTAIIPVLFCFMHVFCMMVYKKGSNPYSWTHIQEETGKNWFCFRNGDRKLLIKD